jgi:hypothetical protein
LNNPRFVRAPITLDKAWTRLLEQAVAIRAPIPVLLLWGKGPKEGPDGIDLCAVEFLCRYAAKVAAAWSPGVRFQVLFADTHAAINGYRAEETDVYFTEMRGLLDSVTDEFGTLSEVWRRARRDWTTQIRLEAGLTDESWQDVARSLGLVEAAKRHARVGPPEAVARRYYCLRRAENQWLAEQYSEWAFATCESPERTVLLPALPVLHLYSWARGRCAKPWFTLEDDSSNSPLLPTVN